MDSSTTAFFTFAGRKISSVSGDAREASFCVSASFRLGLPYRASTRCCSAKVLFPVTTTRISHCSFIALLSSESVRFCRRCDKNILRVCMCSFSLRLCCWVTHGFKSSSSSLLSLQSVSCHGDTSGDTSETAGNLQILFLYIGQYSSVFWIYRKIIEF